MNKSEFIEELVKKTGYSEEDCRKISDILEDNFIIGKKNKEKTIDNLTNQLNYSAEEAEKIYEIASSIIVNEIKDKIKHPFRSKD